MTTLNAGDTYRFKIVDNVPGALDYDNSIEWSTKGFIYELHSTEDFTIADDFIPYNGERIVTITLPEMENQVAYKMIIAFTAEGRRDTSDELIEYASDSIIYTVEQ